MKNKLILSAWIMGLWGLLSNMLSYTQGSIEGSSAVKQLSDDKIVYSLSHAVASGVIGVIFNLLTVVLLLIIWFKKEKKSA